MSKHSQNIYSISLLLCTLILLHNSCENDTTQATYMMRGDVEGYVIDSVTGNPLQDIGIICISKRNLEEGWPYRSTYTSETGYFRFKNLEADTNAYALISCGGCYTWDPIKEYYIWTVYKSDTLFIQLQPHNSVEINFALVPISKVSEFQVVPENIYLNLTDSSTFSVINTGYQDIFYNISWSVTWLSIKPIFPTDGCAHYSNFSCIGEYLPIRGSNIYSIGIIEELSPSIFNEKTEILIETTDSVRRYITIYLP